MGTTVVFMVIVGAVLAALVLGAHASAKRLGDDAETRRRWVLGTAAVVSLWMALGAGYVASGLPSKAVPLFMAFFAVSNVTAIAVAFSPYGTRLLSLPVVALIAPQALRFPLELVLHAWADGGTIPVQMTFEGHNFDIVTGVMALGLVAYGRDRPLPRPAVWAFNLIGLGLLLTVMTIAMLSSPIPIKAYDGPALVLALHLPYALILTMCVAPALFGHVLVFRWLRRSAPEAPE